MVNAVKQAQYTSAHCTVMWGALCIVVGCSETPVTSGAVPTAQVSADAGHSGGVVGAETSFPSGNNAAASAMNGGETAPASGTEGAVSDAADVEAADVDAAAPTGPAGGDGSPADTLVVADASATGNAANGGDASSDAGVPEICAAATRDGGSTDNGVNGSVGAPPNGYLVYSAETANEGNQVFHVRISDGRVAPAVRLTDDPGIEAFVVSPGRPGIITSRSAGDGPNPGWLLTLVDFDASGATASLPLNPFLPSGSPLGGLLDYAIDPGGTLMVPSSGLWFFDLRARTIAEPQVVEGYNFSSSYGWSGSRLLFSGTEGHGGERGIFSADPNATPQVVKLATAPMGGAIGFAVAPNQQRAIFPSAGSGGETQWYLLDLTASVPTPVQLTSPALQSAVSLGVSAWSPDSRYYVAEVDPGGLVLIDVEAPLRAQLVNAEGAVNFTWASFSPDSQRLVYVASHGGAETTQLYGVALGPKGPSSAYPLIHGTEEEQEAYVYAHAELVWMYGSRYVAYLGQNPHASYLADAYGCSGKRVRAQPAPPGMHSITPAPNAPRAAFFGDYDGTSIDYHAYVSDIDDEGNWRVTTLISGPDGTGLANELRFLDSDWLMFYAEDADRRASMYLAPRDGSTPARLLSDPKDHVTSTYWLEDKP